jgi:hypothetical protein
MPAGPHRQATAPDPDALDLLTSNVADINPKICEFLS